MNTTKFRAKRVSDGKWVYGYYVVDLWTHYIFENIYVHDGRAGRCVKHIVDPNTVGQFTGKIDKRGREIYEGDLLRSANELFYRVKLNQARFEPFDLSSSCVFTKIGNIYDNSYEARMEEYEKSTQKHNAKAD